jgi:hypothetical protein
VCDDFADEIPLSFKIENAPIEAALELCARMYQRDTRFVFGTYVFRHKLGIQRVAEEAKHSELNINRWASPGSITVEPFSRTNSLLWVDRLTVNAHQMSLDDITREISRKTTWKIRMGSGVAD